MRNLLLCVCCALACASACGRVDDVEQVESAVVLNCTAQNTRSLPSLPLGHRYPTGGNGLTHWTHYPYLAGSVNIGDGGSLGGTWAVQYDAVNHVAWADFSAVGGPFPANWPIYWTGLRGYSVWNHSEAPAHVSYAVGGCSYYYTMSSISTQFANGSIYSGSGGIAEAYQGAVGTHDMAFASYLPVADGTWWEFTGRFVY